MGMYVLSEADDFVEINEICHSKSIDITFHPLRISKYVAYVDA